MLVVKPTLFIMFLFCMYKCLDKVKSIILYNKQTYGLMNSKSKWCIVFVWNDKFSMEALKTR